METGGSGSAAAISVCGFAGGQSFHRRLLDAVSEADNRARCVSVLSGPGDLSRLWAAGRVRGDDPGDPARTTAEIALQTDHVAVATPERQAWHDRHGSEFLRGLAEKYGLGWIDQRSEWAAYLKKHGLEPKALLTDNVHLNEQGNWLMAEIVSRHLVENPSLPVPETVREYVVGRDVEWKEGRLTLGFTGNRVELITANTDRQPYTRARILVDGKAPSMRPELYAIERPSDGTGQTGHC